MNLVISEPKSEEYPAIVELCNEAAQGDAGDDPVTVQTLIQLCQKQHGATLIAKSDGVLVGALLCGQMAKRNHVERLVVATSHQGQGVEKALLDKVLVKLGSRGAHTFQFPAHVPGNDVMLWDNAKWHGKCDLKGETPMGKPQASVIV